MFPETIIVRHKKEKTQKCSVQPLTKKEGFRFVNFPDEKIENIQSSYIRLSTEGTPLTKNEFEKGLLILDCNWRYVVDMEKDYTSVPARTLPLFKTAYPRVAKDNTDPSGGLATIEAIYIAYKILGRDTKDLLENYYFRDLFLKTNRDRLLNL